VSSAHLSVPEYAARRADTSPCPHSSLTRPAHPKALLLHEILLGVRTTAGLSEHERLGTSGQLYHHLRQLVWLRSTARGQYSVPPERVVPLLTVLAAARR
jgi:hypothetical protein